ncbi:putative 3-demethylubiquinone-9 3-methyltransferase (glyoxalase superfamily) [Bradyrhizobium sp. S3.3.6]
MPGINGLAEARQPLGIEKSAVPPVGSPAARSSFERRRACASGFAEGYPHMTSITPFLWFDNNVPEAVAFYKSVFPNAKVEAVSDFMAVFELEGQRFNALNGGPQHRFNEAVSFFISVETQGEVDYFWSRLTADGGAESKCGWLKDKFGLSWQVVPTALGRYLGDPDRTKANRVMQAMMGMKKIVVADLDKAYAG